MKKFLFIIFQLCLTYCALAQCTFEHYFPYYPAPKNKALLLSDGGYLSYSAAWKDTFYFGLKESDMVLVKTDSCGNVVWINDTGYVADGDPDKYAVEMDSGNIMIVGYTAAGLPGSMGNIRVGKYNAKGKLVKEKLLPGSPISISNGVVKSTFKVNSYLVSGWTHNVGTEISKPLLFELDGNLNIKRGKEFQYSELTNKDSITSGGLSFVNIADSNTIYCMASLGTMNDGKAYLVELDSAFSVKKSIIPHKDTIYNFGFSDMILSKNKSHFDCYGTYKPSKMDSPKECVFKMDLEGNIQNIVYFSDTIYNIACMSPTQDGGYIISSTQLVKIDSNFTVEWVKSIRGWGLLSVEELPGGGYIAAGISDLHTQSLGYEPGYNEMYLVKMDKDGNYIHTGVKDPDPSASRQIVVYPNPTNTTLTIQSKQPYSSIELYNTTGNLVLKETNTPETMSVSALPQGLYILRILGPQQEVVATVKVSVVH
ncbi:MAG: T9SS type A sorting domain-containing protein [Bacteroidota bacterium]